MTTDDKPAPFSDPESLRRQAFHESGHAIVAWALSLEVRSLCIGPEPRTCLEKPSRLEVAEQVAVFLAGERAELRVGVQEPNAAVDQIRVRNILRRAYPSNSKMQKAERLAGQNKADLLLSIHEAKLNELVAALEQNVLLDMAAVTQILGPHPIAREPAGANPPGLLHRETGGLAPAT